MVEVVIILNLCTCKQDNVQLNRGITLISIQVMFTFRYGRDEVFMAAINIWL